MKDLKRAITEPRALALLDQCVLSGSNFLSVLFVSRHVSVDDFGLFSLALLGVLFLSNLHRAFLTQPLNVLGATEDAADLSTRMTVLLRAHIVIVPVSIVLLAALSAGFFPDVRLLLSAACYLGGFLLQETLRRYWYTIGRLDRALSNDFVSYIGQLILLVAFSAFTRVDGAGAFLIMAATSLIAFLLGLRNVKLAHVVGTSRARAVAAQHWTMSGWLILTVLALWGANQLYPFMLAGYGHAAIAYFAVSRNLLSAIGVGVQSVLNYLPTRAAALLNQQGEAEFRRHMIRTLAVSSAASIAFLALMQIFAEPILHVLYRGLYDDAASLVRILSAGVFFSLLGAVFGSYALALQDARSTFLANLGGTVFTFTGGLWLLHAHGIYGAAIGTCLSLATAALLQGCFVLRDLKRLQAQLKAHLQAQSKARLSAQPSTQPSTPPSPHDAQAHETC
jgi:O-antigen/teichoic acid export membrane protein